MSKTAPTLADILTKTAGVTLTPAAATTNAPAPAATAKTAAVVTTPKPAPAVAAPAVDPLADYKKTAAQRTLAEEGILIKDEKRAEAIIGERAKQAEAQKVAEIQKFAAEYQARGVLQFHGMLKESCAMNVAEGVATQADVIKTAAWTGCHVQEILERAGELKKIAQSAAAEGSAAFFGSMLGAAARDDASATQQAALRNGNTTQYDPEAVAGTRSPVRGQDEHSLRFTDVVTIPNNPGLNHGQKTDNGKATA